MNAKCKLCGAELILDEEFEQLFVQPTDTCVSCNRKTAAERRANAEKEVSEHPDWHDSKDVFPQ